MIKLLHGDCLGLMKDIPDKSIDMILCDLPYGKIRGTWDCQIDINKMWKLLSKKLTDNFVAVFFGNEPFSSQLRISNIENYKYDIKWIKNRTTGFANCNYRPMNKYEDIIVFSSKSASVGGRGNNMIYNPQGLHSVNIAKKNKKNRHGKIHEDTKNIGSCNQLESGKEYIQNYTNYPCNVWFFDCDKNEYHPTQKPVLLLEYLIKTFSNENSLVIDFAMGSGSTGVACINTNRNFIGIEKDDKYFEIAKNRIYKAQQDVAPKV